MIRFFYQPSTTLSRRGSWLRVPLEAEALRRAFRETGWSVFSRILQQGSSEGRRANSKMRSEAKLWPSPFGDLVLTSKGLLLGEVCSWEGTRRFPEHLIGRVGAYMLSTSRPRRRRQRRPSRVPNPGASPLASLGRVSLCGRDLTTRRDTDATEGPLLHSSKSTVPVFSHFPQPSFDAYHRLTADKSRVRG